MSKNNSDNEYNAVRRYASAKNIPTVMAIEIAKNPKNVNSSALDYGAG